MLEHASGEAVVIEVKAAETVRSDDFRGIRHLAQRVGDRFVAKLAAVERDAPTASLTAAVAAVALAGHASWFRTESCDILLLSSLRTV